MDPSRAIRYISVRHADGLQMKGLRLIDEDDEYIVNKMWYAKNSAYQEDGQWSTPMEVPTGMEICGIKTNASSGNPSLSISFLLRDTVLINTSMPAMNSTRYF